MKLQVTPKGENELEIVRTFNARRDLVWKCHTDPALVPRWLLGPPGWSMPVCEIDLRVGGGFRYVWRHEDGREMAMRGKYVEIARPDRIRHTETFDVDWTGGETRVTTEFAERANVTTTTITVKYSSAAARDGALQSGMTQGMEAGYANLDSLLDKQAQ